MVIKALMAGSAVKRQALYAKGSKLFRPARRDRKRTLPPRSFVRHVVLPAVLSLALVPGCPKSNPPDAPKVGDAPVAAKPDTKPTAPTGGSKVVLITDVGGRGDQSFNDSALRGLETWSAGVKFQPTGGYAALTDDDFKKSIPADLAKESLTHLGVTPVVVQAKSQEDYEPDLQMAVSEQAALAIGVGFMFENSLETVAKHNPEAKFLLVDSPLLDASNNPYVLPNVSTVTFREQESSFLAGEVAASISAAHKVCFIGGMELPLIKKFESGFKAGIKKVNPATVVLTSYTGTFDNVNAGKQAAQSLIGQGCDVLYHAAGADGVGAVAAAKDAHAAGKPMYVIGCDADQSHLAPDAVVTSTIKHVDLAVYRAIQRVKAGTFKGGDEQWGLKEGGVGITPLRLNLPNAEAIQKLVDESARAIAAGELKVPATLEELNAAPAPAPAAPTPAPAAPQK
jgi:basic membrane protein A